MPEALANLRVLEFCHGTAGSFCGKLLSDLGAEVLKVEASEGGDPARSAGPFPPGNATLETSGRFLYLNTGKRSLCLDEATGAGIDLFRQLLRAVDVLIEDQPPGTVANVFGDAAPLSLIWCSITPFGQTGPYAGYRARHLNVFHAGGEGHLLPSGLGFTQFPERPPLQAGSDLGDFDTGANAAVAVLAAVYGHGPGGRGQRLDVSAQESQLTLNRTRLSRFNQDGVAMGRSGAAYAIGGMIRCRDGYVQVIGVQDEHWRRLGTLAGAEVFAQERFATNAGRAEHAVALNALLVSWCAERTKAEVYQTMATAGFAAGYFATPQDLLDSPQLAAREFFQTVDHPAAGRLTLPGLPYQLSETPGRLRPAPALGAHTEEVLAAHPATEPEQPEQTDAARAPLAGIRVLDFTWAAAGPYATLLLALLGAEVIKVESSRRPDPARRGFLADYGGVNKSPNFNELNLNKRSLQVDLTQPEGLALIHRLMPLCDVVTDNFRAGVMRRLGLGPEALLERYPHLVVAASSGNGSSGPEAGTAGLASIFGALGGLGEQTGYADGPPTEVGESTDYRSGNAFAFAILAALLYRRKSGRGQYIDLSSREAVTAFSPDAFLAHALGAAANGRLGNHHPRMAPHNVYPCRDEDEWLSIAVGNNEEWRALCEILDRPAWAAEFPNAAARKANEALIDAAIAGWTHLRSATEAMQLLQARHIAAMPSFTNADLAHDPHILAREVFVDVPHPEIGRHRLMRAPWLLSETPARIHRHGPLLGQDNDYVLAELLGLGATERAGLADVLR